MNPFERMASMRNSGNHMGVVSAQVVDNVDPQAIGRVRIQFHWLEEGAHSFWARVTTPMAGNAMGVYFLPEIGDEVLVAFEHGKMEYPIVIGSLWNGEDLPPKNNEDNENNIRQIKSRSGHELTFDDTSGSEKFTLQSSASHKIEFDDSDNIITIESSNGNKVVIDDNAGSVTIEDSGGNSIKMEDGKNITINCSGDLKLEGTNVTISAQAALKLESNAGTELTSSAITTVKGALVQIN